MSQSHITDQFMALREEETLMRGSRGGSRWAAPPHTPHQEKHEWLYVSIEKLVRPPPLCKRENA